MRNPNAFFKGGLNTISRVLAPGTGGNHIVGVMPKKGRIAQVRFHGTEPEGGPLSLRVAIKAVGGANTWITEDTDVATPFSTTSAARDGVEAVLENIAALFAQPGQAVLVTRTGTSANDLLVMVNFEPSA